MAVYFYLTYNGNGGGAPATQSVKMPLVSGGSTHPKYQGSTTVSYPTSNPTGQHFSHYTIGSATYEPSGQASTLKHYFYRSPNTATVNAGATFEVTFQPNGGGGSASVKYPLTAQWIWNTYTVTFNANGGSGAPGNQTKTHNATLYLSSTKPTKSGYTFLGWSKSSTATVASWSAGGAFNDNGNNTQGQTITLYAIWRKTLTLSYNANNGSGAPGAQSANVYNGTTSYTFTLSSTKPTRTGYTFLGWSTSSTATSASYQPGAKITISSNTTLYAVWKINTWTVSYNANTGTGRVDNQTKTYGVNLTLSDGSGYSKYVHTLTGWNTAANGSGTAYPLSGTYTGNAALTLYAQWHLDYIEPKVLSLNAYRVAAMEDTEKSEDGQYIRVEVTYLNGTYKDVLNESTLTIDIGGDTVHTATITDATNTIVQTFGVYSKDESYVIEVSIVDPYGSTDSRIVVPTAIYPIDLYGEGQNVYMGVMHPYVMGQVLTTSTQYVDGDIILLIDEDAGAGTLDGDLYQSLVDAGFITTT